MAWNRFDVNSPLVRDPEQLDAIKKRFDAYKADPGQTIDAEGLDLTSAQARFLANSAGDVMWLIWAVDHLRQERRELISAVDSAEERTANLYAALDRFEAELGRATRPAP